MPEVHQVRIDKWLWAVRVFKTRSQATEACRRGRVIIEGFQVKPSRIIKVDEIVYVKKPPVIYSFKIISIIDKRVSASMAVKNYQELTPEEELAKLKINETVFVKRDRGSGRPTKKERRIIDNIIKN